MDISSILSLTGGSKILGNPQILSDNKTEKSSFDSLFQSMIDMINNTNDLTNAAKEEEIKYAAGDDNTLDLILAQNKANTSLSYTVAVRDKVLDAYKEIMNLQF